MKINTSLLVAIVCLLSLTVLATEKPNIDNKNRDTFANTAPVLDTTPIIATVTEDTPAPVGAVGLLVSAFTGGITDTDLGALKGIAIVLNRDGGYGGMWYYSTNNGTTWTPVGIPDPYSVLLLADDGACRLAYIPYPNFPFLGYSENITTTLKFRAWDQTYGSTGPLYNTYIGTTNPKATAFSTAINVVNVTVVNVNDAPTLSGSNTVAYTENNAPVILNSGMGSYDMDSINLSGATVTISGNFAPGQDVLAFPGYYTMTGSYNANTGVLTFSGSASVNTYLGLLRHITYYNSSDFPSTLPRTVSFTVNDGELNSAAVTTTINITGMSEAPVITGFYCSGATTVSGTSVDANGTTIDVYKAGGTLLGTTTVSGGNWTVSIPALTSNDLLTAKATVSGLSQSTASAVVIANGRVKSPTITGSGSPNLCGSQNITLAAAQPAITDLPFINGSGIISGNDQWQTFIPTLLGATTGLTLFKIYDTVSSGTLSIYSGSGINGPLLHTQTFTTAPTRGNHIFALPGLILTPGHTYTFRVQGTLLVFLNSYTTDGTHYSSAYGLTERRLYFSTTVVPTTGSLQWYTNGNSINNAITSSYTTSAAGGYYCSNTVSGCGTATSNSFNVTVNPLPVTPVISGSTTLCSYSNVVLTSSPAAQYYWSNGATTQSITVAKAASYTVKVWSTSGCPSAVSAPVATTVNAIPFLNEISIASNISNNLAFAIPGNTVILSFDASEPITPIVTIAGRSAVVTHGSGNNWTASQVMNSNDATGFVAFTIAYTDTGGCSGNNRTATTNWSSVSFDNGSPLFTSTAILSDNITTNRAKIGTTVTLHFTTSEIIIPPTVNIAGHTITATNTSGNSWSASWVMATEDIEGAIPFMIIIRDLAGNTTTTSTTTNSSSVVFDKTAPFNSISVLSNNSNTATAKISTTVSLSFTASEQIATPTVTLAGHSVSPINTSGNSWIAYWRMNSEDSEGLISFTVNAADLVGNTNVASVTTNGSSVTFDKSVPSITAVSISSTNVNPALAKPGDTVLLNFTSSENTPQATVTLGGHVLNAVNTAGNNWQASYIMTISDATGVTIFSVTISDLAGNTITRTTTTNGSTVTFNNGLITPFTTVSIQSNNQNPASSTDGDVVTVHFVASETIQNISIVIGGIPVAPNYNPTTATWSGSTTVASSSPEGPIPFSITVEDSTGNPYTTTATTDGSSVTNYPIRYVLSNRGPHGIVSPNNNNSTATTNIIAVLSGQSQTFTFTPDSNYYVSDVLIDGNSDPIASVTGSYTFPNVNGNHELIVYFALNCLVAGPPTLNASSVINCGFQNTTLAISSGSLNDSANWNWYADTCEGTPLGTGASIQVSPLETTTYYARGEGNCTANGTCGSITITVNPLPITPVLAIAYENSAVICEGETTQLEVTTGNGTSYLWSNGMTSTSNTLTATGNYTVTATNAFGCQSLSSNEIAITVNPKPAIPTITPSGPTLLCPGTSITLTATPANSYLWSTGETTQSIIASTTGSYQVEVATAAGCKNTSVTTTVTAIPSLAYENIKPFVLNGMAVANDTYCYSLTDEYNSNQVASAWYPEPIDLNYDFDLQFTKKQCGDADGMVFALQNSGTDAIGNAGRALGYYAYGDSTGMPHSLGVEFDIHEDSNTYFDPNNAHISIVQNGNPTPIAPFYNMDNNAMNSCTAVPVRFTWNHITQVFSVYYDNVLATSYTSDLINTVFEGNPKVYMGFTAATGELFAEQSFCVTQLNYKQDLKLRSNASCDSAFLTSNASSVDHYLWNTGATTPSITVTTSGTYSLTVSTNSGCSETATTDVVITTAPNLSYTTATTYPAGMPITPILPILLTGMPTGYEVTPPLPWGMDLNTVTGEITGTPIAVSGFTTYTIHYFNDCGSADAAISFAVECTYDTTPHEEISVAGNTLLCQGESVVLSVPDVPWYTYAWSTGETSSSILADITGSYSVTITNVYGCKKIASSINVTENIAPVITYSSVNSLYPVGAAVNIAGPTNSGSTITKTITGTTILENNIFAIGMVSDPNGNIYYGDAVSQSIKKLDNNGAITTYSSLGDAAVPFGIARDAGNNLYVTDNVDGTIKKIATDGTATTLYSGLGNLAGIALDPSGNIYYSELSELVIKKIAVDGTITTAASNILGAYSMYFDASGNLIFADAYDYRVKKMTPNGVITVIAGGFTQPIGMAHDANGAIYVADAQDFTIKRIALDGSVTTVLTGTGPLGPLAFDLSNHLYTSSLFNSELLKLTLSPNYSITPALPPGINFNGDTGAISGTVNATALSATYTITTQNSCGTGSATLSLVIGDNCPIIISQPEKTIICATVGSTAFISVGVSAPAVSYTWQYRVVTKTNTNPAWITITNTNAAVYANYNSSVLNITRTATLPTVGTEYRVLISTDNCLNLTSDTAALTILSATKAGTITAAATVCQGNELTFTLGNYAGTSFQWQSSPFSSGTAPGIFTDIPGATETTYILPNAQLNSDRSYRVVAFNSCNNTTATTATKTITVNPLSVAGTITVGGGTICEGGSGSLKIAGYVGKIQWEYSEDGVTYSAAPKASAIPVGLSFSTTSAASTATSYVPTNMTVDIYFRAKVTSGACSSAYTSPVQYLIGTAAVVGTISGGTTLCPATGTTLTLSNATGTITWEKSTTYNAATPIWVTTTNHSLVYPTGNLTLSTAYRAKITIGTCSTFYSDLAYVLVVTKPLAKTVTANITSPTGKSATTAICSDSDIKVLTIGAGYNGAIQWQVSTTSNTAGFADISGATGVSYTVTNAAEGVNYFRATFTNSCGVSVNGVAIAVYYKNCTVPVTGESLVKAAITLPFNVVVYPNPYSDNFYLNLTTASDENVKMAVYDMTGKLLDTIEVGVNEASELPIGNHYASGIYSVVVTQGIEVKTLRIIKL
jgi:hypothetical protein